MLSAKTNAQAGIAPGPGCENPGAGDGTNPVLERALENSVTIVVVKPDGEVVEIGSGYFMAGTEGMTIGTAKHVVEDFSGLAGDMMRLHGGKLCIRPCGGDQAGELLEVEVGDMHAVTDVAVVHLESPTNYPGLEIAPAGSAAIGEEVWMTGMTGSQISCGTANGTISAVEVDLISQVEKGWADGLPPESLLGLDIVSHPGNSGCAVLDAAGRVVGILVASPLRWETVEIFAGVKISGVEILPPITVKIARVSHGVSYAVKSEELTKLDVERPKASGESPTANEPAEEGFSVFLPEELLEFNSEGLDTEDLVRDALLRRFDSEGMELDPEAVILASFNEDKEEEPCETMELDLDAVIREACDGPNGDRGAPEKMLASEGEGMKLDLDAVVLAKRPPEPPPEPPCPPPEPGKPGCPPHVEGWNANSLHQQWVEANPPNEQNSLPSVDWGREIAVGKAFAAELAVGPGKIELPGTTGDGIESVIEPDPGVELLFG